MKNFFFLFLAAMTLAARAKAQTDTIPAGWGTMDFNVPESPAFKILGTDPNNILKPTSVKTAIISVGNYFVSNGPIIPKSLAVELSPLLLNSKASLKDYRNNKFLYRTTISLGTNVESNGSYAVAEGIRFTIADHTDLRTDPDLNNFFRKYLNNKAQATTMAVAEYSKENNIDQETIYGQLDADTVLQKAIQKLVVKYMSPDYVDPNTLSNFRSAKRQALWNKYIWQVGIAALQSSTDSLIENLKFAEIGFWTSTGIPVFKTHGQVLLGGKAAYVDSSTRQFNASLGARLYYGSNQVKAFLQGEYDYKNNSNSLTASAGCQFNITNGLWGEFTINIVVDSAGKVSYKPGLNLGFGTPEMKKS
jgi:hypothetical protein